MKRVALIVSLLLMFAGQAQAEKGDQYYLLNLGYTFKDATLDPDPIILASFSYGYGLNQKWALEFDYFRSVSGGAYKDEQGSSPVTGDYSIWAVSANAAFRHLFNDSLYFKGKIGYTYGEDEFTSSEEGGGEKAKLGSLSGGLGIGYLAGAAVGSSLTLELMLAKQASDLFTPMLGVNVTF